jgi:hypothetical protein
MNTKQFEDESLVEHYPELYVVEEFSPTQEDQDFLDKSLVEEQ